MPVVVRELVIRARVEDKRASVSSGSTSGIRRTIPDVDIEKLVAECVEKTLQAIERKQER